MEFTIDDLHYYSYPIPCVEELGGGDPGARGDMITLFNVVIVTVKRSAVHRILQRKLLNLHSLLFAHGAVSRRLAPLTVEGIHRAVRGEFESLARWSEPPTPACTPGDAPPLPSRSGQNALFSLYGMVTDIHDSCSSSGEHTVTGEYFLEQLRPLVASHYCRVSEPALRR